MSNTGRLKEDLHPDIRDLEDLILDGYLDEFEALELFQDAEDAKLAEAEATLQDAIGPPSNFGFGGS